MMEEMRDLRVAQERLRGHAADVEADPAPMLGLDDRDGLAELGRADGGDLSARSGAPDVDVDACARVRALCDGCVGDVGALRRRPPASPRR